MVCITHFFRNFEAHIQNSLTSCRYFAKQLFIAGEWEDNAQLYFLTFETGPWFKHFELDEYEART